MMGRNFLLLVLVLASSLISAKGAAAAFDVKHHEFTKSLRSLLDMRPSAMDDEELVKLHSEQWRRLETPSHADYGKKHHYYVKYPDDCNACQIKTLQVLGEKDYHLVSQNVGHAFATHEQMKSLFSDPTHKMVAYTPSTSATKVSAHVGKRCAEFNAHKAQQAADKAIKLERKRKLEEEVPNNEGDAIITEEKAEGIDPWFSAPPNSVYGQSPPSMPGRVLIEVAALPSFAEFEDFKTKLRDLAASYGANKVLLDEHDFLHEKGSRISYFQLNVPEDDSCELTPRLVDALSNFREVTRVEEMLDVHTTNRWSKPICQTNNEEAQPITVQKKLDGTGQVVGILDTGMDMSSCYFNDPDVPTPYVSTSQYNTVDSAHRKVVTYMTYKDRTDDGGGHGSHVAGTVAGNSTKAYGDFVKYNGMVYNAKIAFFDIGDTSAGEGVIGVPSNLETGGFDLLKPAGAFIITNSWGSSGVNYYSTSCKQSDSFMWNTPEALVLYAAGNTGNTNSQDGSVNSPAGAKNVLSVGATLNAKDVFLAYRTSVPEGVTNEFGPNYLAYFSSRGPTNDNRIKPDVTAPGWWIVSAGSVSGAEDTNPLQCTIATLQGTSMSTPTVAGYAAMLRQYCREGWYPTGAKVSANSFSPSGSLLKAMLIHSAQKLVGITKVDPSSGETSFPALAGNFPNSDYGYGRINMELLLNFDNPNATPNDPLTLMMVGAVKDGTAFDGGTMGDSNMYQECTQSDDPSGTKAFYIKTGSFSSSGERPDLKATLVYTDYPGTASSGSSTSMINLLDVEIVQCGSGSTVTGTGAGDGSCSSEVTSTDSFLSSSLDNPVAQVVVEEPADNTVFMIRVKCISITHDQPYSLVITQDIGSLSYDATDFPFAPYVSSTEISINAISADAQVIIVVFSILAFVLGIISFIVYTEHKRADELDEKDLDEQASQMAALQEQQMQQMRAEQGRR